MGLKQAVEQKLEQCKADFAEHAGAGRPWWEHRAGCCRKSSRLWMIAAAPAPGMLDKIATAVEQSKAKDDVRGVRVIDDYAESIPLRHRTGRAENLPRSRRPEGSAATYRRLAVPSGRWSLRTLPVSAADGGRRYERAPGGPEGPPCGVSSTQLRRGSRDRPRLEGDGDVSSRSGGRS